MKTLFTVSICLFSITALGQGFIPSNTEVILNEPETQIKKDTNGNIIMKGGAPEREEVTKTKLEKWLKITDVYLYGAGNILGLVTASEDIEETAAPTGSLGINFKTDKVNWDIFYSFNSKQSIEVNNLAQFGNTLMNPNVGGQAISLKVRTGLTSYYGGNITLKVADNTYKLNDVEIDASPFIFSIGGYLRPFDFGLTENKVNLTLDVAYTYRSILGDFGNNDIMIDEKEIGSNYNGIDISLNTYLNSVKAYVQFSFNEKGDFDIPGFSGTQVLFGIDISGSLIKLK